jgi:hypothetical protein
MVEPLIAYHGQMMRTVSRAACIAVLLLGILGAVPAQADDPPTESGEQVPIYGGGDCHTNQNAPYASSNHAYLQSTFQVTCTVLSGYRIIRMHTDAKYGASPGGGSWTQYSNNVHEIGNGVNDWIGTISYNPLRDTCHWGGDWNFYRRTVTLQVTVRRLSTGVENIDTITFYKQSPSRIPCGDHE